MNDETWGPGGIFGQSANDDAELASARAEVERLRHALRTLLLSRDAAWTGGHDWQEAVDGAITALGIEVDE